MHPVITLGNLTKFYLNQLVKVPTIDNTILDLFLTNRPNQVHSTTTLPSLRSSDNNTVFHEIKLNVVTPPQIRRRINYMVKLTGNK